MAAMSLRKVVMKSVELPNIQALGLKDVQMPMHSVKVKIGNNINSIMLK